MIHHDSAVAQGAIGTLDNTGVLDGASASVGADPVRRSAGTQGKKEIK